MSIKSRVSFQSSFVNRAADFIWVMLLDSTHTKRHIGLKNVLLLELSTNYRPRFSYMCEVVSLTRNRFLHRRQQIHIRMTETKRSAFLSVGFKNVFFAFRAEGEST